MMNFRIIKDSIINNVLYPASVGKFVLIGSQKQSRDATETLDLKRTVQVYYSASDFSKSSGRLNGPVDNSLTYRIELTVSSAAKGNLSLINDSSSSAAQIATAIAAFQEASDLVDCYFDELVEEVYQIIMSGLNYDLGLPKGTISNRWIQAIQKDNPEPRGGYVTLTGAMNLTCNTAEQVPGDIGTLAQILDTTIDLEGDDVERTGVTVDNT